MEEIILGNVRRLHDSTHSYNPSSSTIKEMVYFFNSCGRVQIKPGIGQQIKMDKSVYDLLKLVFIPLLQKKSPRFFIPH